jgi:predicted RNA-binding protein with PUA-like domain
MSSWLLKTEPSVYSYDTLERDGHAVWDGVTNNLALKHLRTMKKGDLAFIYHSGEEKAVVGIASITSNAYPDPKSKDEKLVVIDIKPKERLKHPVALSEIKQVKNLASFELVRLPRLSVMPVSLQVWSHLIKMSK